RAVVDEDDAMLAHPARLRDVDEDAKQPRAQARTPLEPVDAFHEREPGVLHDLFGDLASRDMRPRDGQHRRAVPVDDRYKGALVTAPQRVDKSCVLDGGHNPPPARTVATGAGTGEVTTGGCKGPVTTWSAVFGVVVVEAAAGIPFRALVAVRGN